MNNSQNIFEKNIHDEIIFLLSDIGNFFNKKGDIIAKKAGLTTLQWIVLLNIARDPNLPIVQNGEATHSGVLASEIAANRGVSRANISPIISTLIKNKLITQKDHPKDRRRKTLHVSEKGMSALKSIQDERRFLNDRLFDMISNDDQTVLTHSLKRLLNTVSGFPHVEIHENVS
ncbi:MAG: MarR family transcriptional regulator [Candidatus Marinimicrobia bacterium]|jgi:DNA-binding MarR family transcriptional regulator|nr:MarR family transcriptional regulator [Candidatus Neomarinimicrobiota bacterium]MBT3692394.1 MarR family transcriptional regulator [Candidatus Neomarinimicrobiota bacterium]MBT3732383.1 MarR family transcriptional regulator [Candidatus Neomarinimicrobiota bacterium]MBT4144862.1 MarR family transcriptional regulator [Candidatus Neomarinimicrobiota bacterium]MBT4176933.1 MarR family transcriptional regulator [Candidatus Neomarinimicrobiota bacterium]